MGENEPYVLSAVVPQRAHLGSETQFSADNQPEKRGRPPGSRNKMPRALNPDNPPLRSPERLPGGG
jgi:hypothetical protein